MDVDVEPCKRGDVFINNACIKCRENYYSLIYNPDLYSDLYCN